MNIAKPLLIAYVLAHSSLCLADVPNCRSATPSLQGYKAGELCSPTDPAPQNAGNYSCHFWREYPLGDGFVPSDVLTFLSSQQWRYSIDQLSVCVTVPATATTPGAQFAGREIPLLKQGTVNGMTTYVALIPVSITLTAPLDFVVEAPSGIDAVTKMGSIATIDVFGTVSKQRTQ